MVAYSKVCDYDVVAYREYLRATVCEKLYNGSNRVDIRAPGGVFDLRLGGLGNSGEWKRNDSGVRCGSGTTAWADGSDDGTTRSTESKNETGAPGTSDTGNASSFGAAGGGVMGEREGNSGSSEHVDRGVSFDVRETVGSGLSSDARGKHWKKNQKKRENQKNVKQQWRSQGRPAVAEVSSGSGCGSACSVQTVDTRTGVEIEAAQTLAVRRVEENKVKIAEAKVAAKLAEHRLRALNDKERSLVIDRLAAARLEEKINTAKQKSQASFKGCGSPIESVGSALSAHEFAFKQQVRKIEAMKVDNAYQRKQVEELLRYASPDVRRRVAEIPEPYIPTDEEMEAEDLDQSPEPSDEEMEAEAERYFSGVIV